MKNIKVLHIIKNLRLGGAEINLFNLLNTLRHDNFEFHVAYAYGGELEPRFRAAGFHLFKYADEDHKVGSLATFGIIGRLMRYIWQNRIDIIHTHTFSAHIWGSMAAKLTRCKIVEHVHDFRYLDREEFARRRGFNKQYRFIRNFRNLSDRVVVLTKQNRDFLLREDMYPPERIYQYQNGIPLPDESEKKAGAKAKLVRKFSLPADPVLIFTSIRIAPEKNIDLILRIAPKVIAQVPNAVFLIAGDGPLYCKTFNEIKNSGFKDNIRLIGYAANIRSLLEAADIFLLPSFLELHSIALLEAMSMRVPVVISRNVGCHNEFIDSWENGVLLDPFQDEGWAEALVELLENPHLRRTVGDNGYRTCQQKFDIRDTAKRFEEMYAELMAI